MEQDTSTPEPEQQPPGGRRRILTWFIVLCAILLVGVAAFSGGSWVIRAQATQTAVAQQTGTAQSEATSDSATAQFQATSDSATATTGAQTTATSMARAVATSTQRAYEIAGATSTAQAAQAAAGLPDAHLEIYDPFNTTRDWDTSEIEGKYSSGARHISDGVYTWNVTALRSVIVYDRLLRNSYKDFYLSVDVRKIKGPDDAGYGLLFRCSRERWYAFEVVETRYLAFSSYYGEQWHTPWYYYRDIARHGEINTLAVNAQGNLFTLFVNGEKVREVRDSHIESGGVGLFMTLQRKGDEAIIEFDNFLLLVE